MRALVAVVLALVAVFATVWCLAAAAGSYSPPGGDFGAQWLSNSVIVYHGLNPETGVWDGIRAIDVDASPPVGRLIVSRGQAVWVSPNRQLLAFQLDSGPNYPLVVSAADGTQQRTVFSDGYARIVGWLPDSSRLIFSRNPGGSDAPYYSIRSDGTDLIKYPTTVRGSPSPDGSRFAYVSTTGTTPRIHIVTADGSSDLVAWAGSTTGGFVWSPDGTKLAFWNGATTLVVAPIGGKPRTFTIRGSVSNANIVWSPDSQHNLWRKHRRARWDRPRHRRPAHAPRHPPRLFRPVLLARRKADRLRRRWRVPRPIWDLRRERRWQRTTTCLEQLPRDRN